jgi:hypothetical protein
MTIAANARLVSDTIISDGSPKISPVCGDPTHGKLWALMTAASSSANWWLFVAHDIMHLESVKSGESTWWCVSRLAVTGDQCFVYKPLWGVLLHFQVLRPAKNVQMFCSGFAMATAEVKVLEVFEPPITAKDLKTSPTVRQEGFMRRNFQGGSFRVGEPAAMDILKLSKPTAKRSK